MVADASSSGFGLRSEPFSLNVDLAKGVGSLIVQNSVQIDAHVEIEPGQPVRARFSLDITDISKGNFTSIGTTQSAEFTLDSNNTFEPSAIVINSSLNTKIKEELKTATLPDFSVQELLGSGLVKDGDAFYFFIGKCVLAAASR